MLVIGLDFGTLSVRAQVVDAETGTVLATAIESYRHGVIDRSLPENGVLLAPQWALQHPQDWLDSMTAAVRAVVKEVDSSLISGLGIDTTGCSVLPVKSDGTPLSFLPRWKGYSHAWPKLWKHNSAQAQAERFTEAAVKRGEKWLERCGGAVSPAFMLPKALELLEEAPLIYQEADLLVEESDWLVWQLTGAFRAQRFRRGVSGLHPRKGWASVQESIWHPWSLAWPGFIKANALERLPRRERQREHSSHTGQRSWGFPPMSRWLCPP